MAIAAAEIPKGGVPEGGFVGLVLGAGDNLPAKDDVLQETILLHYQESFRHP